MGATRDVAMTDMPMRGISVNADAAGQAVTLVASDSGIIFINKEDAGTVTYTLPAVASGKGKMFLFFNAQTTAAIAITSPTADTLMCNDDAAATTNTSAADTGSWCMVVGDGSFYYCLEGSGTWTAT